MGKFERGLSRREALSRAGALVSVLPMQGCSVAEIAATTDLPENWENLMAWPHAIEREVNSSGYGTDPNLISPPPIPWPNVLTNEELNVLAEVAEFLCPGATSARVPEVLSEWLSAPYPAQSADRDLIVPGLVYLNSEARVQFGTGFADLSEARRSQMLVPILSAADQSTSAGIVPVFLARLRALIAGAYFSSAEGSAELGYVGNRPIAGAYPGPSREAEAHLESLLAELGL